MDDFYRGTELDAATFPEWRDHIQAYEPSDEDGKPRSYPGYPRWPLPALRARWRPSLDTVLLRRRSRGLGTAMPDRKRLARLLGYSHGVTEVGGRGPVPSAGGLQALEAYLMVWEDGWLPAGCYHYDRRGHWLAQVAAGADRTFWREVVPSLRLVEGGALLWVLVGDGRRASARYAGRGLRFLLLEAGHLMQCLCLLSESLGLCTVPLGGFLERPISRRLALPAEDMVLYVAACGPMQR